MFELARQLKIYGDLDIVIAGVVMHESHSTAFI